MPIDVDPLLAPRVVRVTFSGSFPTLDEQRELRRRVKASPHWTPDTCGLLDFRAVENLPTIEELEQGRGRRGPVCVSRPRSRHSRDRLHRHPGLRRPARRLDGACRRKWLAYMSNETGPNEIYGSPSSLMDVAESV